MVMAKTDSAKYFDDQMDDENVKLVFRKHPIVMRKGLIIGSIAILIGPIITTILSYEWGQTLFRVDEAPTVAFFNLSLLGSLVLAAILFFPSWMSWYFSVFVLTDQRFIQIKQQGFFNKSLVDISIDNISMINYEVQGVQETLLGFGTIVVQTFAGELVIHEVHHPAKIQREMTSILRSLGFLKQGRNSYNQSDDEEN